MRRKKVDPTEFGRLLGSVDLQTNIDLLPSPCIGICRVNAKTRFCEGCLRTIDEITAWGGAAESEKRIIWQLLAQRYAASPAGRTDSNLNNTCDDPSHKFYKEKNGTEFL